MCRWIIISCSKIIVCYYLGWWLASVVLFCIVVIKVEGVSWVLLYCCCRMGSILCSRKRTTIMFWGHVFYQVIILVKIVYHCCWSELFVQYIILTVNISYNISKRYSVQQNIKSNLKRNIQYYLSRAFHN